MRNSKLREAEDTAGVGEAEGKDDDDDDDYHKFVRVSGLQLFTSESGGGTEGRKEGKEETKWHVLMGRVNSMQRSLVEFWCFS
ncbi:unnamed protein product [Calypogeia fissa]